MQLPHSSNQESGSDASGSTRIEPTIGENKPAPWDVTPEAAPAFEMIEEPAEAWEPPKEPSINEPDVDVQLSNAERTEPVFLEPDFEPLKTPVSESKPMEADFPGLTGADEVASNVEPESLTIPTEESASNSAPSLTEEPKPEAVSSTSSSAATVSAALGAAAGAAAVGGLSAGEKNEEKKLPGFFAFMKKEAHEARANRSQEDNEAPTEEQLVAREKTRNRLIGAAALLMAVVVSSSFILDNEELAKDKVPVSTEIPPVPEKSTMTVEKPAVSNAVAAKEAEPVKTEVVKPVVAPEPAKAKSAEKKVEKAVEKKAETKPEKKVPAEPQKKVAGKGYFIQIVVTGSEQKAERIVHDLKRLKLPAYSEQIKGKKGPLWRVRIGHFKTEKEAQNTVAVLALNGYTGKHYIDKQ